MSEGEQLHARARQRPASLRPMDVAALLYAAADELRAMPPVMLSLQGDVALGVLRRVLRVVCRVVDDIEHPTKRDD